MVLLWLFLDFFLFQNYPQGNIDNLCEIFCSDLFAGLLVLLTIGVVVFYRIHDKSRIQQLIKL